MKKSSKNKLAMYKATKTVIAQHSNAWGSLGAFGPLVSEFESKVGQLEELAYQQNFALIGVSEVKNRTRLSAVEQTIAMVSSLRAYAIVNNDPALIAKTKLSLTELRRSGIQRTFQRIDHVLKLAIEHLPNLSLYGVDQTGIDALQALRDQLEVHNQAPRNAIIQRRVITAEIHELETAIDRLLRDQLDQLVNVMRRSEAAFYRAYTAARTVVDAYHPASRQLPPERDDGKPEE